MARLAGPEKIKKVKGKGCQVCVHIGLRIPNSAFISVATYTCKAKNNQDLGGHRGDTIPKWCPFDVVPVKEKT